MGGATGHTPSSLLGGLHPAGTTGHTPSSLLGGLHPAGITAGVPLASFPGSCGGGEEGRVWCPSHYSPPPPQEPGNEARAPIRLQVEQLAQGTEEERADCHVLTAKGLPEPKQVELMPKLRVVGNGVSVKSEPWPKQAESMPKLRVVGNGVSVKSKPWPKQVESMPKLRVVGNGVSVKSEPWICLPLYSRFEHNYLWSPKSREITRMLFMAVGSTCF